MEHAAKQQHATAALALASVGVSLVAISHLVRVVRPSVELPPNAPVAGLLAGVAFAVAAIAQSLIALRARQNPRLIVLASAIGLAVAAAGLLPLLLGGGVRV